MIIKTTKLTKTHNVEMTSIQAVPESNEIEFIKSYDFTLKYKLSSYADEFESNDDLAVAQNISIQKIDHFVRNYLDNAIWYDTDGIDMINDKFSACENLLIVTPECSFTCLGLCLYAKLNSLCKDGIVVTEVVLKDVQQKQEFEYSDLMGESPDFLPTQEEFMGKLTVWENSWWHRDDLSTYDNRALSEDDLERIREDVAQAEESIKDDFEYIEEQVKALITPNEEAEVIEIDFKSLKEKSQWKPRLV